MLSHSPSSLRLARAKRYCSWEVPAHSKRVLACAFIGHVSGWACSEHCFGRPLEACFPMPLSFSHVSWLTLLSVIVCYCILRHSSSSSKYRVAVRDLEDSVWALGRQRHCTSASQIHGGQVLCWRGGGSLSVDSGRQWTTADISRNRDCQSQVDPFRSTLIPWNDLQDISRHVFV